MYGGNWPFEPVRPRTEADQRETDRANAELMAAIVQLVAAPSWLLRHALHLGRDPKRQLAEAREAAEDAAERRVAAG